MLHFTNRITCEHVKTIKIVCNLQVLVVMFIFINFPFSVKETVISYHITMKLGYQFFFLFFFLPELFLLHSFQKINSICQKLFLRDKYFYLFAERKNIQIFCQYFFLKGNCVFRTILSDTVILLKFLLTDVFQVKS